MSGEKDNGLIHFTCQQCGQKIRIAEIHAGKKAKCPKCKNTFVVPKPSSASSTKPGDFDLIFQDGPEEKASFEEPAPEIKADQKAEDLRKLEELAGTKEPEPVTRRKLPVFIDVFLYPANFNGLKVLGFIIVIPLLIHLGGMLPGAAGILVSAIGGVVKYCIGIYVYWYFCECIRESANDTRRAGLLFANCPDLLAMGWQMIKLFGCNVLLVFPVSLYFVLTRKTDVIFYLLLLYSVFFFQMGLLAITITDSIISLNPVFLIRSVCRTFLPYCGLTLLFCIVMVFFGIIRPILSDTVLQVYILYTVYIYLFLVAAHVLGRFYFRYQDKLDWDA